MANIRPNIRQHPLLSRYPGSEYSVGYSPGMLASAYAHDGESTGFYDYMCVESGLKRVFNTSALGHLRNRM